MMVMKKNLLVDLVKYVRPRNVLANTRFSAVYFLALCFMFYKCVSCCNLLQQDTHWNQQTSYTVTTHKQTNKRTHTPTHTDLILVLCATFTILFFHIHSTLHTKTHLNLSILRHSTTDLIFSTQFPLSCFPLMIQQFFTPYLLFLTAQFIVPFLNIS